MSRKIFSVTFYILLLIFTYVLLKDGVEQSFLKDYDFFDINFVWMDKLVHLLLFATLMFTLQLSNGKTKANSIFLLIYGLLIEILQGTITETRTADIFDFLADAVGIYVGFIMSQLKFIPKILKLKN